jgi:hypothetical protein
LETVQQNKTEANPKIQVNSKIEISNQTFDALETSANIFVCSQQKNKSN